MDCNSIIYDVVRSQDNCFQDSSSIIRAIIHKIEEYVEIVKPSGIVYIAFDGVAPFAKLNQQRERRYKSWYQNEIAKSLKTNTNTNTNTIDPFNTVSITPGTEFMNQLNEGIKNHFLHANDSNENKNKNQYYVTGSDEYGEGEHKLFAFLRKREREKEIKKDDVIYIYGLDADLIMLCINHLPLYKNLYLFRETPSFIQSLNTELEPDAYYYLDIPLLNEAIFLETGISPHDYIFLCFFLGNDFLPHFPSLNIRTGGIHKLLNFYNKQRPFTNVFIDSEKEKEIKIQIYWNHVLQFVGDLEKEEVRFIQDESKQRAKLEKRNYKESTVEEIMKKFENLPTIDRNLEKYINPSEPGWEKRYYKSLFFIDEMDETKRQTICHNYLQGLEWTFRYYTEGCPDWRWSYNYHYPPLLQDLKKQIPPKTSYFKMKKDNPVSCWVQLSYVLPRSGLCFLPETISKKLLTLHPEWYRTDNEFIWAYCKYFWESHVVLEEININELENILS
jgi:5'-3' exonuclease